MLPKVPTWKPITIPIVSMEALDGMALSGEAAGEGGGTACAAPRAAAATAGARRLGGAASARRSLRLSGASVASNVRSRGAQRARMLSTRELLRASRCRNESSSASADCDGCCSRKLGLGTPLTWRQRGGAAAAEHCLSRIGCSQGRQEAIGSATGHRQGGMHVKHIRRQSESGQWVMCTESFGGWAAVTAVHAPLV